VNAPGPQDDPRLPPLDRLPVSTFTEPNVRATCWEPQSRQGGCSPVEYAEIDIRTSNEVPQS
jgi:hypothetical protein